jgi:hypothetical protein
MPKNKINLTRKRQCPTDTKPHPKSPHKYLGQSALLRSDHRRHHALPLPLSPSFLPAKVPSFLCHSVIHFFFLFLLSQLFISYAFFYNLSASPSSSISFSSFSCFFFPSSLISFSVQSFCITHLLHEYQHGRKPAIFLIWLKLF